MRFLVVLFVLCLVPVAQSSDDRSDPMAALASYYEAINARDYRRVA